MAEEEVLAVASPAPTDHKRKLEDLELEATEAPSTDFHPNSDSIPESDPSEEESLEGDGNDESDTKRPRLDDQSDGPANGNGHVDEKLDEAKEEVDAEAPAENSILLEEDEQPSVELLDTVKDENRVSDEDINGSAHQPSDDNPCLENPREVPSKEESLPPAEDVLHQGDGEDQSTSRKMEVPNTKVGVLIGKAGETIRFLQYNSGARIQIVRDSDADPSAPTRPVELIGTLESINKAEKLIKDVIAEADAGGSPSLVARGFSALHSHGATEQIQIQIPNDKVGSIIGKGGETIKNLQTRSGARIQLIPQHLPEGDQSKERTVRVTGDKEQIELAREMIKEVMNQPRRQSSSSGGYNQQQGFHPRRPPNSQWGQRGSNSMQPGGYDYQHHQGPYQSQNQYPPRPSYGNYPPQQQQPPRSNYVWDQRPPSTMQPPPQGGYDYRGHTADAPPSNPMHTHQPTSQPSYNYAQPTPYSQNAPPAQNYGHGYNEPKYENQPPPQQQYGAQQQPSYQQGYAQPPPSYGVPPQGPQTQNYGQPRPGDMPYQGPQTQSYGQNGTPQQPYPYAVSGPMQQSYPQYASAPTADGYTHPAPAPAAAPAPVYPQQTAQPVAGYTQPGGQPAPAYAQVGPTANYAQYPTSQPGYSDQAAPNNPAYGYQTQADPAYGNAPAGSYGAPPASGQPVYSQPAPTQPGYDQTAPQTAGYGVAPVGYKSLSPQPGYPHYDPNQMYAGQR